MKDDELILIGALDQPLPADSTEMLEKVEKLILNAVEEHNVWKALNVCKELIQVQKISGLGLAKSLFLVRKHWSEFNADDAFEDTVYEYIGVQRYTVDRYVAVWDMFEAGYIPKNLREDLKQRNIKDLIPIANALSQGHEIDAEQWEKIAEAPNFSTVSKIVREDIKGSEPRSGSLTLSLDGVGTIWAFYNGERYFIGSLEISSDEDIVLKAIKRITDNSGILRSN